jgi:hypothetical protein
MAVGDNISNINSQATDAANKAKENAAQAQAKAAEAKAKIDAAKAQALAAQKKAKELADKAKKVKEVAEKQKEKAAQLKKSLSDKKNFLKDQTKINPADARAAVISAVLPILMKFVDAEKVANLLINKLINDTKTKLKDKGRVVVVDGAITFIPKDKANYDQFKADFERKVNQLKSVIKTLKDAINLLMTILKVVKAAVVAFKVYATILKIRLKVQAAASAAELASPSPSKPITIQYLISKQTYDDVIVPLNEKITNYGLIALSLSSILKIYQRLINNIQIKLNTLKLTIVSSSVNDNALIVTNELTNTIDETTNDELTDTEYSNGEQTYIIRVIKTPSGALQAIALDSFTKLKITQTAPSKFRKADELIDELKQILG